ncbi:uncharacterized protein [Triticum aestivum]|uniref:uncharacterized protein isoform X1 n=1 Tax=Triticum aestivum TaxID=4565 RepID=UPI001D02AF2C|nr:uncharacterized protein LOC123043521 isoform X1 [Triticum aestivum]
MDGMATSSPAPTPWRPPSRCSVSCCRVSLWWSGGCDLYPPQWIGQRWRLGVHNGGAAVLLRQPHPTALRRPTSKLQAGHNASRQASTHGFVNWLGCVLGRLGWMRTMETMSSSPAMAGAHDRLLNGQVSATFSVNDDAYQIFYCSPIHIIDVKSDLLVLKLMA